jgi:MFS family permease
MTPMATTQEQLLDPQQTIDLTHVPAEVVAAPMPPGRLGRDYLKLWLATAVSNIGDGVRITALPLLAATITRNPLAVAGLMFAGKLPWLALSLHAGAIADRVDRRRLIVGVNILRAIAMGILGIFLAGGMESIALLYGVAVLQGVGEVFSDNAAFALMPSIVPKERLEDANGRLEAAVVVTNEFAGPALGGLLFAAAAAAPFILDGGSFLLAGVLIASISYRSPIVLEQPQKTRLRDDIAEGVRWLRDHTVLRNLSLIAAVTNLMLFATFSIQVLFALEVLGLSSAGFGLLLSAEAFGALFGSLLAGKLKRSLGARGAIVLALGVAAVANIAIATSSSWVLVGAMAIATSFAGGLWNVMTNSLRQSLVPDRLLGRVQSAHRLLSWGAIPLGSVLGGVLAASFNLHVPFLVAGVSLSVMTVAVGVLLRGTDGSGASGPAHAA